MIQQAFEQVRRQYFPRWKAGEQWLVAESYRSDETRELGFCDGGLAVALALLEEANAVLSTHEIKDVARDGAQRGDFGHGGQRGIALFGEADGAGVGVARRRFGTKFFTIQQLFRVQ